ncbi:MAG: penicillin-binding protein 2 [Gammaproteobacteria bacterium]
MAAFLSEHCRRIIVVGFVNHLCARARQINRRMKTGAGEMTRWRLHLAALAAALLALLLVWRWNDMQVNRFSYFSEIAQSNQIVLLPMEPARGRIFDRRGRELAGNDIAYTLQVDSDFAADVLGKMDTLRGIIRIPDNAVRELREARGSRVYKGRIVLRGRLAEDEISAFLQWHFLFPEILMEAEEVRRYPLDSFAAHVIGHVGRLSAKDEKAIQKRNEETRYRGAKFVGKTGIERVGEGYLRGILGVQEAQVDAHGRILRRRVREAPGRGRDIYLTLDMDLQRRAEDLLAGERGAVVLMDVRSGAVLALASSPRFDVNMFTFGISQKNWNVLNTSDAKPLIHRAIYGQYAPGSTIKPFFALAALERGWRDLSYSYTSRGYFQLSPNYRYRDWKKGGHGETDIAKSIIRSVNTFYYQLAHDVGIEKMHTGLAVFGFGAPTNIGLDNEKGGVLPSAEWKKKALNEEWYPGDTIAAAVGQGYFQATPLQMARAMAGIASGKLPKPHLRLDDAAGQGEDLAFSAGYLSAVRDALARVTQQGGTAPQVNAGAKHNIAGKTGTAQVSKLQLDADGERIKNEDLPKKLRDHAWFVGYAPAQKPKIAIAVLVENGGSGGKTAAPIARNVVDLYFAIASAQAQSRPPRR